MTKDVRVYNNNNNNNNIISVDVECDNINNIITITNIDNVESKNECIYKITSHGKVLIPIEESKGNVRIKNNPIKTDLKNKESLNIVANNLFQEIPTNLAQEVIEKIKAFSKGIIKTNGYGEMYPYSVKLTDDCDIQVIMLMYNGNSQPMELTKFPFKLMDANDKVIIRDFIDINTTINPNKIGICQIKLDKYKLTETNVDLANWKVTFEVE
jgi:SLAP domain-containing protein